jgi:haloalkane dehalogenase
MERRHFLELSVGTVAFSAINGCTRHRSSTDTTSRSLTASDYQAARRFSETKFGRIAYIERGKGDAALFLHGFPLNNFQWRGVLDPLSGHRRCVAPDFLGLGFTEVREGESVAPNAQVEMLGLLLDSLSIKSVDLIANDSGGAIAQLFVARYPQRVRTLLLTNCDTEPDSPPPAVLPVIELARVGKFADEFLVPSVADKALARSEEGALGSLCYSKPGNPTDEAVDYYLGPLVSSPLRKLQVNAYAVALAPNPLAGIEAKLKQCTIPMRVVWGTADKIFASASPDYLDRTFPHSRGVRRITGAKLFFPEEYPELIAEEALGLWRA